MASWPGNRLVARSRVGFLELFDNLQDAVSAHHRIVHNEFGRRCIFESHGAADQTLDSLTVPGQKVQPTFLLLGVAEDTDEDDGTMKIPGDINIVNGHQASFTDRELTPNDFPNLALEE